jgi:hypothetical protein
MSAEVGVRDGGRRVTVASGDRETQRDLVIILEILSNISMYEYAIK